MKILVYGAGVLGSQLAHVLYSSGHDVTLLARGKKLKYIKKRGLAIRHYIQLRTTVDKIKVTDRLDKNDSYDLVFVVMQYQQTDAVLDDISACLKTRNFAFLGNNLTPEKTAAYIEKNSPIKKNIYFGFFWSAGRIENNRVISVHWGRHDRGGIVIGSLKPQSFKPFKRLAKKGKLKVEYQKDIDAWLKSHAAFVLPVCYAVYACGGSLKGAPRQVLKDTIKAADEGYDMLKSLGIEPTPAEDADLVKNHRLKTYMAFRFCAETPLGRLLASDHAGNAVGEMTALHNAFGDLRRQSGMPMPVWDRLEKYMPLEK